MDKYLSPTTDGLLITFRAYLIELVCLNIDPNLSGKFWKEQWWANKFKREVRGVKRLADTLDFEDKVTRLAICRIIEDKHIKSLSAIKTTQTILNWIHRYRDKVIADNVELKSKTLQRPKQENFEFTKIDVSTKWSKIKSLENEQKK